MLKKGTDYSVPFFNIALEGKGIHVVLHIFEQ
jgi:hypothetical protein